MESYLSPEPDDEKHYVLAVGCESYGDEGVREGVKDALSRVVPRALREETYEQLVSGPSVRVIYGPEDAVRDMSGPHGSHEAADVAAKATQVAADLTPLHTLVVGRRGLEREAYGAAMFDFLHFVSSHSDGCVSAVCAGFSDESLDGIICRDLESGQAGESLRRLWLTLLSLPSFKEVRQHKTYAYTYTPKHMHHAPLTKNANLLLEDMPLLRPLLPHPMCLRPRRPRLPPLLRLRPVRPVPKPSRVRPPPLPLRPRDARPRSVLPRRLGRQALRSGHERPEVRPER